MQECRRRMCMWCRPAAEAQWLCRPQAGACRRNHRGPWPSIVRAAWAAGTGLGVLGPSKPSRHATLLCAGAPRCRACGRNGSQAERESWPARRLEQRRLARGPAHAMVVAPVFGPTKDIGQSLVAGNASGAGHIRSSGPLWCRRPRRCCGRHRRHRGRRRRRCHRRGHRRPPTPTPSFPLLLRLSSSVRRGRCRCRRRCHPRPRRIVASVAVVVALIDAAAVVEVVAIPPLSPSILVFCLSRSSLMSASLPSSPSSPASP